MPQTPSKEKAALQAQHGSPKIKPRNNKPYYLGSTIGFLKMLSSTATLFLINVLGKAFSFFLLVTQGKKKPHCKRSTAPPRSNQENTNPTS